MSSSQRWPYLSAGIFLGLTVLAGMFFLPRPGWSPELIRIGVVNWEQVILQYEGYQDELEGLQSKRTKILRMIEEQYGDVDRQKLEQSSGSVSGDEEMQQLYEETLKQHEQRRQKAIEEYHRKIKAAIREEAIEQGYSLILSENEVLYAAEGYTDLTNGVIERLNENDGGNASDTNGNLSGTN